MDRSAFLALLDEARRSISGDARGTLAELLLPAESESGIDLDREPPRLDEPDDPDAALPGIVSRCRLRAEVARDVARRARTGGTLDERHLHQAKSEGASVWMADLLDPRPDAVETLAACLDAVADAAELVVLLRTFEPDAQTRRAEAVKRLAAVQSALRLAAADLRLAPDEDQMAAFTWLKDTTARERIYVERHMRLDDPLDPALLHEVLEAVHADLSGLQARADRQERLRKANSKLKYLSRQLAQGKAAPGDSDKLADTAAAMVADGLPPSSLKFRDALFPVVDVLPPAEGRDPAYGRVLAELQSHAERLVSAEAARDATEEDDHADPLLSRVHSPHEAVELARAELGRVVIPLSATGTVGVFDSVPEVVAWGRAVWKALRALDAYAGDAKDSAGFWDWCATSGSPLAWPATSRRLAMTESETVQNGLIDVRRFEVDTAVDPSGKIVMLAHCKIGGGGTIQPRVYFHDDTKGATGKVHIGFVGPHREVPNASTN